jgi:ABC-type glutathione transport system ATPase component
MYMHRVSKRRRPGCVPGLAQTRKAANVRRKARDTTPKAAVEINPDTLICHTPLPPEARPAAFYLSPNEAPVRSERCRHLGLRKNRCFRRSENLKCPDVGLRVQAGEVYSFIGPNGAGKATAIRIFPGILKAGGGGGEGIRVLIFYRLRRKFSQDS